MEVQILSLEGEPWMSCSLRMARMLLKGGLVKVVGRAPFTVQYLPANR